MTVKLSVITATWNSASTLPATLESISEQVNQEFELIVVDGGSADATTEIIKSSPVVDRWISESDKGIYDALNKGIRLAQGEYVGFMHSDDIFAHNRVTENLLECIKQNQPEAIYADLDYVQKDDVNKVVRHWKSGAFNLSKLKLGWMPPHPTFYMKRSLYEKYGLFDLSYKIAADYDSLMRYLYVNKVEPYYIPEVLVKMRVGGASNRSLANIIQKSKEDIRAMRANGIPVVRALVGKNISKIPQFLKKS